MDLIYADANFKDIGVLQDFTLDMAYGIDENNFEIKMPLQKPMCEAGWFIYIDGTEYGGIIDAIGADTNEGLLIFRGRTWNGILATKVIEPDEGSGYYNPQGEANSVVAEIIERCDLGDIFAVSQEDSGIIIDRVDDSGLGFRYDDVNTGIFTMLYQNDAKLKINVHNEKAYLSAVPLMNYATDEFDSSQMKFSLIQTFAHCNHLICLGQGQLEKRYIIHLFTDEHGGILPYVIDGVTDAIKDSQYILDKSSQLLTGRDEYTEVYDYPDAAVTENFELLTEKPDDWDDHYDRYYEKPEDEDEPVLEDSGDNYTQLERRIEDVYTLTPSQPYDWTTNYTDYFTKDGDYYEPVEPDSDNAFDRLESKPSNWKKKYDTYYHKVDQKYKKVEKVPKYTAISKKPKDWTKSYGNYYLSDGAGGWSPVPGKSKTWYDLQTQEPSDWRLDWGEYYVKYEDKEDKKIKYHKLKEDDYYSRLTKAPKWKKNTFYVQRSKIITPEFNSQITYYSKKMIVPTFGSGTTYYTGPYYEKNSSYYKTWQANTFYKLDKDVDLGVEFESDQYFRLVLDHYAELVAGGIDRLAELNNSDELILDIIKRNEFDDIGGDIYFDESDNTTYDIGDIVGGNEEVTGVYTAQPITKKIINIDNNVMTIQHEVR